MSRKTTHNELGDKHEQTKLVLLWHETAIRRRRLQAFSWCPSRDVMLSCCRRCCLSGLAQVCRYGLRKAVGKYPYVRAFGNGLLETQPGRIRRSRGAFWKHTRARQCHNWPISCDLAVNMHGDRLVDPCPVWKMQPAEPALEVSVSPIAKGLNGVFSCLG